MNILRQPSWIMAYMAARAMPPAPITNPVVLEGWTALRGERFLRRQVDIPIQSVLSPYHAQTAPAQFRRFAWLSRNWGEPSGRARSGRIVFTAPMAFAW